MGIMTTSFLSNCLKKLAYINNMNTIQADVLVVGGGIIGCIVASELAEKGLTVVVLDVPTNKIPYQINSKNIKIDQQVNHYGLGGNEGVWSQLTAFIEQDEWEYYSRKFKIDISYCKLQELAKKAQLYGFYNLEFLQSVQNLTPSQRFKKYIKKKSLYCYSDLLRGRENITILEGVVKSITISEDSSSQVFDSNNNNLKIKFDKIVLAAGGIGNYYIANKYLRKNLRMKPNGVIKLHSKFYSGYYSLDDEGQIKDMLDWKRFNGGEYFYGIVGKPSDVHNAFNEDMCQFTSVKWYESKYYLFIKMILWHKSSSELIKLFKDLYSIHGVKIIYSPTILKIFKNVVLGSPSVAMFVLTKLLKIKWKNRKYLLLYHHSNTGRIRLSQSSDSVSIDSCLTSADIGNIGNNLKEMLQGSGLLNIKEFTDYDIQDANHFNGTLACNIDGSVEKILTGVLDNKNKIFSVGTSNIPFSTNVNPTFLAICFAFLTIEL